MKHDKTSLAGAAACGLLLLVWFYLGPQLAPPPTPDPAGERPAGTADPGDSSLGKAPHEAPPEPAETPEPAADRELVETPDPDTIPDAPRPARVGDRPPLKMGQDGLQTVTVDPAAGGIVRTVLLHYANDADAEHGSSPVALGETAFPFCALTGEGLPAWETTRAEETGDRVVVRRSGADTPLTLVEEWRFTGPDEAYRLDYVLRFHNGGPDPVQLSDLAVRAGALPPTTSPGRSVSRRMGGGGGVAVAFADAQRPRMLDAKGLEKRKPQQRAELATRSVAWLAVHSKYFLFWLAPEGHTFQGCRLDLIPDGADAETEADPGNELYYAEGTLPPFEVPPGEEVTLSFRAYAGPKKFERLDAVGDRLIAIMDMDRFLFFHPAWMGFITRHVLRALVALNRWFDHRYGYGLAIIVLTVAVKLLFWPLTHHSTVSMRKMQTLQPMLKDLRDKYKDNPQKLYRKQQELYRENKVSPLGGCLPMLLQIPVFFALFNTFRNAIELRHAAFLWAADLSLPDTLAFSPEAVPIRPLAIAMGACMLLQQKLSPAGGDPSQKRMMTFMSVFFIFIFYSMPSGLTLYWTVNQLLTMVQTLVTRELEKRKQATG